MIFFIYFVCHINAFVSLFFLMINFVRNSPLLMVIRSPMKDQTEFYSKTFWLLVIVSMNKKEQYTRGTNK